MYTALYRQWRPDTFKGVVGQDTIVRTLKNQIATGRIAHAYLFCGSRGTGKTSTAKILSRAINCQSPTEDGPCGVCDTCVKLASGSSVDIIEIDAASNNGVDDVRELRENVKFPPVTGKYKVYIIDEVHMLSAGAFNALLKTLEEPPKHAVFILATTEPHKLPATILSRCQRFDFKRIPLSTIVDRMKSICGSMGVTVEDSGLYTIARWAEGGMRDALSLLDQCIGFCGTDITNENIISVLGTADQDFIYKAAADILSGNSNRLLHSISVLIDDGKDITVFLRDLLNHLRNLMIMKFSDDANNILDMEANELARLKEQAAAAGEARLIRSIEILSGLEADLKYSSQPRVLFELAVVRMCRPQMENSMEALLDRIETIENQLKNGMISAAYVPSQPSSQAATIKETAEQYVASAGYVQSETFEGLNEPIYTEPASNGSEPASDSSWSELSGSEPAPSSTWTESSTSGSASRVYEPASRGSSPASSEFGIASGGMNTSSTRNPADAWPDIVNAIKKQSYLLSNMLEGVKPRLDNENLLTLIFGEGRGFELAYVEKEDNRALMEDYILKLTGRQVRVRCMTVGQAEQSAAKDDDLALKRIIDTFGDDVVEVVDE